MSKINSKIKEIITKRLSVDYTVRDIKKIPGGFRSRAYKITATRKGKEKKFFLKHIMADPPGLYQSPADKLSGYLLSQEITDALEIAPKSLGVFLLKNNKITAVDYPKEKDIIFQLQEFCEGENYLEHIIDHCDDRGFMEKNKGIIDQIVSAIIKIHKKKIKISDKRKSLIYKKSLRNPLANSELGLAMIEDNIEGSLFKGKFRYDYIVEMMRVNEYFWPKYNRLCLIHGDFWPGNIILTGNEPVFLDYSRYKYGDPGVDVGHFYLAMLIYAIIKKNKKYLELGEYSLGKYEEMARDKKIRESAVIAFGSVGVVFILENFFPGVSRRERKKFADYIMSCMKNKKVIPYNI